MQFQSGPPKTWKPRQDSEGHTEYVEPEVTETEAYTVERVYRYKPQKGHYSYVKIDPNRPLSSNEISQLKRDL